jgi:hypothetical protein
VTTGEDGGVDVDDTREAAALIRRILEAIERGELDAPATVIARLEGALVALEALSEEQPGQ